MESLVLIVEFFVMGYLVRRPEVPRRHPGQTQEASRSHQGGAQKAPMTPRLQRLPIETYYNTSQQKRIQLSRAIAVWRACPCAAYVGTAWACWSISAVQYSLQWVQAIEFQQNVTPPVYNYMWASNV